MPQEFYVVRCYKCETFQVQIVKKIPKWECKICGEKQSVRKVYGKGTSRDCRTHVQKLNVLRAETVQNDTLMTVATENPVEINFIPEDNIATNTAKKNKWLEFLDKTELKNQGFDNINENYENTEIQNSEEEHNFSTRATKNRRCELLDEAKNHNTNNSIDATKKNKWYEFLDETELRKVVENENHQNLENFKIGGDFTTSAIKKNKWYEFLDGTELEKEEFDKINKNINENLKKENDFPTGATKKSKWFEFLDETELRSKVDCLDKNHGVGRSVAESTAFKLSENNVEIKKAKITDYFNDIHKTNVEITPSSNTVCNLILKSNCDTEKLPKSSTNKIINDFKKSIFDSSENVDINFDF